MTYFIYNKFKNKLFYLYDLNDYEKKVGNIENYKTSNNGYLIVDAIGLDADGTTETNYENRAGGDGAQASNVIEENKEYAFNVIAINNGYNHELVTQVNKIYDGQFLYMCGIDWETRKGFATTVIKSDDFSLEDGFFSYTSQSANKLYSVSYGETVKDITFDKDIYSFTPVSNSDILEIQVADSQECIVRYPNTSGNDFTIANEKNNNKFTITGSQKNVAVNAYDRTASSDSGNLFPLGFFAGGFIFLDQGTNRISLSTDTYGETVTIEVIQWRKTRKASYV